MNNGVEAYKLFRQLEAREKRTNPYKFYDKDELIDEILKNEDEIERLYSIIKEVREYIKFLKEHYEELRTSPVEDSYFINDMLRQMFIQSIENYLLGIEDILDKENK